MIALADCNNFYASCERAFRPALVGRPIVVLSNNDGCVIARSAEAKAIGIEMGAPAFKMRSLIEDHGVEVFSSNYTLYADMSRRVMNSLAELCPRVEVYSIDEAFVSMEGMAARHDLADFAAGVRAKVLQWTKIPVSLGVAPTKTLAKLANKLAKKGTGVKVISTDAERRAALISLPIGDVWGIGRQHGARLSIMGLETAWDFARLDRIWVRAHMGVVGERMWYELNGTPCLPLLAQRDVRENICTSRSFGQMLTELGPVSEAIATHAHRCAEKLRAQGSRAHVLTVFLHTNRHRPELPQYNPSLSVPLAVATSNTPELVARARAALRAIWRPGYQYKKAGVIVTGLVPEDPLQGHLFDTLDRRRLDAASAAMDVVNRRFGRDTLRLGAQGYGRRWQLRSEQLSPCYTTRWADIPRVFMGGVPQGRPTRLERGHP